MTTVEISRPTIVRLPGTSSWAPPVLLVEAAAGLLAWVLAVSAPGASGSAIEVAVLTSLVTGAWLLTARSPLGRATTGPARGVLGIATTLSVLLICLTALGSQTSPAAMLRLAVLVGGAQLIGGAVARRLAARGRIERVAVVGSGELAPVLTRQAARAPRTQVLTVGHADDAGLARLRTLVAAGGVDRVLVAPGPSDSPALADALSSVLDRGVAVGVVPMLADRLHSGTPLAATGGVPVLPLLPAGPRRVQERLKRGLDVVVAGVALLTTAPLLLVAMAMVRRETPGPALFRQVRIGRDGLPFELLKLRTMTDGAHALRAQLANDHDDETGDTRMFKAEHDPRVTRIGRLLRRTSLDELPQLLNVVRGDMSLVGPRPLVADEDTYVQGVEQVRRDVRAGITGPWQVNGRSDVPFGDMVAFDRRYARTWSVCGDVSLLLRTVPAVLRPRRAS